jgi:hypothetical protein
VFPIFAEYFDRHSGQGGDLASAEADPSLAEARAGIPEIWGLLDSLNSQTKCNTFCIRYCNGTTL